ncbi:hypothetical protein [Roseibium sp. TrichSKD4]|uniref:hypothetical protein n=1 Tax=Roseibium sp. TrichSKD4 TaxID=744980 RepID=UPI000A2F49D8|nr:hypothetical protein [Roseibium sp. TrichSKD4]
MSKPGSFPRPQQPQVQQQRPAFVPQQPQQPQVQQQPQQPQQQVMESKPSVVPPQKQSFTARPQLPSSSDGLRKNVKNQIAEFLADNPDPSQYEIQQLLSQIKASLNLDKDAEAKKNEVDILEKIFNDELVKQSLLSQQQYSPEQPNDPNVLAAVVSTGRVSTPDQLPRAILDQAKPVYGYADADVKLRTLFDPKENKFYIINDNPTGDGTVPQYRVISGVQSVTQKYDANTKTLSFRIEHTESSLIQKFKINLSTGQESYSFVTKSSVLPAGISGFIGSNTVSHPLSLGEGNLSAEYNPDTHTFVVRKVGDNGQDTIVHTVNLEDFNIKRGEWGKIRKTINLVLNSIRAFVFLALSPAAFSSLGEQVLDDVNYPKNAKNRKHLAGLIGFVALLSYAYTWSVASSKAYQSFRADVERPLTDAPDISIWGQIPTSDDPDVQASIDSKEVIWNTISTLVFQFLKEGLNAWRVRYEAKHGNLSRKQKTLVNMLPGVAAGLVAVGVGRALGLIPASGLGTAFAALGIDFGSHAAANLAQIFGEDAANNRGTNANTAPVKHYLGSRALYDLTYRLVKALAFGGLLYGLASSGGSLQNEEFKLGANSTETIDDEFEASLADYLAKTGLQNSFNFLWGTLFGALAFGFNHLHNPKKGEPGEDGNVPAELQPDDETEAEAPQGGGSSQSRWNSIMNRISSIWRSPQQQQEPEDIEMASTSAKN